MESARRACRRILLASPQGAHHTKDKGDLGTAMAYADLVSQGQCVSATEASERTNCAQSLGVAAGLVVRLGSMRWEPSRRTSALSAAESGAVLARSRPRRHLGGRDAGAGGAGLGRVPANAGGAEPAGEPGLGRLQGLRRSGVDAVPARTGQEEAPAREDRAGAQGQVVRAVDPEEPDHREGARPHHERAGRRPRGAGADDRVPPQAVGGGRLPPAPDGQGAAGLHEVDRQVRGRDRCRARRACAAARRAVRAVRAGWLAAPVPAGRIRLARLQRAAQRQRLHRRRRLRLAAQRPGQSARGSWCPRASTPLAASP